MGKGGREERNPNSSLSFPPVGRYTMEEPQNSGKNYCFPLWELHVYILMFCLSINQDDIAFWQQQLSRVSILFSSSSTRDPSLKMEHGSRACKAYADAPPLEDLKISIVVPLHKAPFSSPKTDAMQHLKCNPTSHMCPCAPALQPKMQHSSPSFRQDIKAPLTFMEGVLRLWNKGGRMKEIMYPQSESISIRVKFF